jgi:D-tyrosyl-tRNA(Tyr) deacylase
MKALVQRVTEAGVSVEGCTVAEIGHGFLVLLCVVTGDDADAAAFLARKTANLRIFDDAAGKMNRSLLDVGGSALVVSQFTLAADTSRGNRPSYTAAAPPEDANALYESFCDLLAGHGVAVARGVFAAQMAVRLVNDGPVTIWLESPQG